MLSLSVMRALRVRNACVSILTVVSRDSMDVLYEYVCMRACYDRRGLFSVILLFCYLILVPGVIFDHFLRRCHKIEMLFMPYRAYLLCMRCRHVGNLTWLCRL